MGRGPIKNKTQLKPSEIHWTCTHVGAGMNVPLNGNRTSRYGRVAVVHKHVWRTLCSGCATGARGAQPVLCNS